MFPFKLYIKNKCSKSIKNIKTMKHLKTMVETILKREKQNFLVNKTQMSFTQEKNITLLQYKFWYFTVFTPRYSLSLTKHLDVTFRTKSDENPFLTSKVASQLVFFHEKLSYEKGFLKRTSTFCFGCSGSGKQTRWYCF